MDDQELEQILDKLRNGVDLTTDEMRLLAQSTSSVASVFSFLGSTSKSLMSGMVDLTKQIARGEMGMSAYNKQIEDSAKYLADWVRLLPFFGDAIADSIEASAEFAQAVTSLSQDTYEGFQRLQAAGVTGTDGLTGLAESAQDFGYGLDRTGRGLQAFLAQIEQHSGTLGLFGGSVADNRKALGIMARELQQGEFAVGLRRLGLDVPEVNEALFGYSNLMTRLGRQEVLNSTQTTENVRDYAVELDRLTRLTGVSADSLQKQMDAQLSEERFAATLAAMDPTEALNFNASMAAVNQQFPYLAQGLRDISSGFVNTEAAQQAILGGFQGIPDMLKAGDLEGALQAMGTQARANVDQLGSLAQVGAFGPSFGNFSEQLTLSGQGLRDFNAINQQIVATQKQLMAGQVIDVEGGVQTQQAQMAARESIQNFIQGGIEPATRAVSKFADALARGITTIDQVLSSSGIVAPEGYTPYKGARAGGGPTPGGEPVLVGEQGPEIITPTADATVATASQTSNLASAIAQVDQQIKQFGQSYVDLGNGVLASKIAGGEFAGNYKISDADGTRIADELGNIIATISPQMFGMSTTEYADGTTKQRLQQGGLNYEQTFSDAGNMMAETMAYRFNNMGLEQVRTDIGTGSEDVILRLKDDISGLTKEIELQRDGQLNNEAVAQLTTAFASLQQSLDASTDNEITKSGQWTPELLAMLKEIADNTKAGARGTEKLSKNLSS